MLYYELTMKNNMLLVAFLFVAISIVAALYFLFKTPGTEKTSVKEEFSEERVVQEDTENEEALSAVQKEYSAVLIDVSGGNAFGRVVVSVTEESYFLRAVLENLPAIENNNFYEGWLVIPEKEGAFVSTGEIYLDEKGVYINDF